MVKKGLPEKWTEAGGGGGEGRVPSVLGSGNSLCKGPEPLLQLRNCALVFSSPVRVCPWSVASLKALGTGASLEQVLRKRHPSFYTATLISNMKTVKGRGPAAGQRLQVYPFGLGKTTAWSLLLRLGGLRPRPCPGTPHPRCPRSCQLGPGISGLWVRIPPRLMELSSHVPQARVPALSLSSVHCGPCGHTPCLQLLRDLRPVTSSQASLYSSLE